MTPYLVLCMKWGTMYGPEYVNRLRRGVQDHLSFPHRFICFTDDGTGLDPEVEVFPLPPLGLPPGHKDTRWQKLALFRQDLFGLQGTALFLDLDLVIVGNLDPFFELPGTFRIVRDYEVLQTKPLRKLNPARDRFLASVGNSSVFRYEIGAHSYILDDFVAAPEEATRSYNISQQFQSAKLAEHGHLDYWPKGWCVSFKYTCVPKFPLNYILDPKAPDDTKIVVFAGEPKMEEVIDGRGHRWYRRIGNIDWLKRAWLASDG